MRRRSRKKRKTQARYWRFLPTARSCSADEPQTCRHYAGNSSGLCATDSIREEEEEESGREYWKSEEERVIRGYCTEYGGGGMVKCKKL